MKFEKSFTPALGTHRLTLVYDFVVAMLTRESVWRRRLVRQVGPILGDRIVDVGCGTGSLAILLKQQSIDADVIGIDPDPAVIGRARKKAVKAGTQVKWLRGFLTKNLVNAIYPATKVVSSLVLHQTPLEEKQQILDSAFELLEPGGELHIADYGLQRSQIMRFLFRQTVQRLDGVEDTQPNADGILSSLISRAGFIEVTENEVIRTVTGSISIYQARRP